MKKQIVSIITCVILAVCFVAPVSAANILTQTSGSASVGDVSIYWTIDYRGYQVPVSDTFTAFYTSSNNTTTRSYGSLNFELPIYNFSLTIRNRGNTIAVADLNDFQFLGTNIYSFPDTVGFLVFDEFNCNVYNVDFNNSSNNLYFNFRSTESLILEPDEQIVLYFYFSYVQFDSHHSTSASSIPDPSSWYSFASSPLTLSKFTLSSMPTTYSTYTMDEYIEDKEGFWPFLLRKVSDIYELLFNQQNSYDEIEDDSYTTSNSASSAEQTLNDVHEQESQWYQDNSQAISATGLSNFQYSQDQLTGISHVVGQWQQVWSALGSWAVVYQFVLMLSLATFILRHRPTTKLQQRQKERDAINEFNWGIRYARERYWQNRAKWSEQQLARSSPDSSGNGSLTALALKRKRGQ